MKRILISVALMVVTILSLSAQQYGDNYLFGGFEILSTNTPGNFNNQNNYAVELGLGTYIHDNIMVDIAVGLSSNSNTSESIHIFTLLPELSYHMRLAERVYYTITLEGILGYGGFEIHESGYRGTKGDVFAYGATFAPMGLEFFLGKNISIWTNFMGFIYQKNELSINPFVSSGEKVFTFTFSPSVRFVKYF